MTAVGVDACAQGWVAVVLRPDQRAEAHVIATIGALPEAVPDASVVGIDIPIGLPTAGPRAADLAARAALGARRSSLFLTPVRAVLASATYAEANARSVELTGAGISHQSYALRRKIFEVEAWLPSAPCPVYEVHPELSFTELLGRPARATKKSWQGMVERWRALATQGIDLDHIDEGVGARTGIDDLLDAAAAAWTARRILAGSARPLPDPPEVAPDGRPVAIWV